LPCGRPGESYSPDRYDYYLPACDIAQTPTEDRPASGLLVLDRKRRAADPRGMHHRRFRDICGYLSPRDCLILNRTRVIAARLRGFKHPTGGSAEVLLLEPGDDERWKALLRPARRLRPGVRIVIPPLERLCDLRELPPRERVAEPPPNALWVEVARELGDGKYEVRVRGVEGPESLSGHGSIPLPPYIGETPQNPDRYQTVYAEDPGSVAAPTAGLHFDEQLLETVRRCGVAVEYLTLHIGLDTFRPVRSADIREHEMHREFLQVPERAVETVRNARAAGGRAVAVGTTVVRALETAARGGQLRPYSGQTDLFIYPGFQFRAVDAMITNFHLPRSTLLMLVSAFAGRDRIMAAYREARRRRYRFYSFGDAMFII